MKYAQNVKLITHTNLSFSKLRSEAIRTPNFFDTMAMQIQTHTHFHTIQNLVLIENSHVSALFKWNIGTYAISQ